MEEIKQENVQENAHQKYIRKYDDWKNSVTVVTVLLIVVTTGIAGCVISLAI